MRTITIKVPDKCNKNCPIVIDRGLSFKCIHRKLWIRWSGTNTPTPSCRNAEVTK